ncbi:hypothetical protein GQ457_02G032920 [Hibiscus cannabinus]
MAAIPSSQHFSSPQMQQFGFQGVEGAMSSPLEGILLRNCAFVDFENEALASQAHRQLNCLRFLGKVLLGERGSKPTEHNKPPQTGVQLGKDFSQSASFLKDANSTRDLNQGSRYAYPPPDGNIFTSIINALIAVPRFYTQVFFVSPLFQTYLNISYSFLLGYVLCDLSIRMALPTPPLPPPVPAPQPPSPPASSTAKPHLADASSSESQIERSMTKACQNLHGSMQGKKLSWSPATEKNVAHEAVGVKPSTLVAKEIPKKNPFLQIKITPKQIPNEPKDDDANDGQKHTSEEPNREGLDAKQFASAEELEKGMLPREEILSLPMFKNYRTGNPAVLYMKNVAKDVVPEDFYFIFGGKDEGSGSSL